MTHEFKNILSAYKIASQAKLKSIIATVVAVDGSSYRGAGVRMLVLENDKTIGAISGGCVEKEVVRQAQSVLKTGVSKLMTYDGRFRLGCEGTLFVLLEEFSLEENTLRRLEQILDNREEFYIKSYFNPDENAAQIGSMFCLNSEECFSFSKVNKFLNDELEETVFSEKMTPVFRLVIIGIEHDAVSLCSQASRLGWEVLIVASSDSTKEIADFEGATEMLKISHEDFSNSYSDQQTAFVIMNHNYAKDLLYLKALKDASPAYIGLLGPSKRKEQMLSSFIEYHIEVEEEFLDCIYGPAGLDIGAETADEIAVSILSEIIAVSRKKKAYHLQDKKGTIHDRSLKKNAFQ